MTTMCWRWTMKTTPRRVELALLADSTITISSSSSISHNCRIKKFLRTSAPCMVMKMAGECFQEWLTRCLILPFFSAPDDANADANSANLCAQTKACCAGCCGSCSDIGSSPERSARSSCTRWHSFCSSCTTRRNQVTWHATLNISEIQSDCFKCLLKR